MSVRLSSYRLFPAAAFLAASLATVAQPAPAPPAPPTPPEPARAYRVFNLGSPVSFLGIGVKEINGARAKELKLQEEAGIEVTRVDANSPAEKAGLKAGDAVLEYQGTRVEGTEQFVRLVRETPVGRNVKLKIVRGGNSQTLMATIAEREGGIVGFSAKDRERLDQEMARVRERIRVMPEVRIPDIPQALMGWRSGMIGIDGESVEKQLAEFFGVKEGVLVRSVAKDMPAEKAGIKAGDVIVRVEDTKVQSPRDITAAIRAAGDKKVIKIAIVRQKAEMTLDVQVERERQPAPRGASVSRQQEFQF